MTRWLGVVLIVGVIGSRAAAQPATSAPAPTSEPVPASEPAPASAPAPASTPASAPPPAPTIASSSTSYSESTALWLSLGGTVATYAMWATGGSIYDRDATTVSSGQRTAQVIGGIGVLGTFFAPTFGHWYAGTWVTRGMGIRALSLGAAYLGLVMMLECGIGEYNDCGSNGDTGGVLGGLLLLGGGAGWIYGTVDDIIQAPARVRRLNAKAGIAIVPTTVPHGGGLALVGRF